MIPKVTTCENRESHPVTNHSSNALRRTLKPVAERFSPAIMTRWESSLNSEGERGSVGVSSLPNGTCLTAWRIARLTIGRLVDGLSSAMPDETQAGTLFTS